MTALDPNLIVSVIKGPKQAFPTSNIGFIVKIGKEKVGSVYLVSDQFSPHYDNWVFENPNTGETSLEQGEDGVSFPTRMEAVMGLLVDSTKPEPQAPETYLH